MFKLVVAKSILFTAIVTASAQETELPSADEASYWWQQAEQGKVLMDVQRFDDAKDALAEALDGLEEVYGKDSVELVPVISVLAHSNGALGRPRTQTRLYDRALELVEEHYGRSSAEFADLSLRAGRSLSQYSASKRAARLKLREAQEIYAELVISTNAMTARTAMFHGQASLESKDFGKAQHYFLHAVEGLSTEKLVPADDHIKVRSGLVSAYVLDGRSDMANEHCVAVREWMFRTSLESTAPPESFLPSVRFAPPYPPQLLADEVEGYVDLAFVVNEKGFVQSPEVVHVEGHWTFIPAALRALCAFTYKPRIVDGEPVAVEDVKTRISFVLN